MSFTKMYMSATFPESSSLDSIGSVAANFARTAEDDDREEFLRYSHGSGMADMIRDMYGVVAHEAYLKEMQRIHEADALELAKQQARRRARRAAVKKVYRRVLAFVAKVMDNP